MIAPAVPNDRAIRVVKALISHPEGLSRLDLAGMTGLSHPTVQRALTDLRASGWISSIGDDDEPRVQGALLRLQRPAGLIAAVDVGRRHVRATIANLHGNPLCDAYEPDVQIDVEHQGATVLESAIAAVVGALALASADAEEPYRLDEVRSLAVGVPTPVGPDGRAVGLFLPQWSGLSLIDVVTSLLQQAATHRGERLHPKLTIGFAKDADLGALAAWREFEAENERGAPGDDRDGQRQEILVFVKASHGLDAGLVCQNQVVSGRSGMAAQIGHMWVPPVADVLLQRLSAEVRGSPAAGRCPRCTRTDCLEQQASGNAQLLQLRGLLGEDAPADLPALIADVTRRQTERPVCREVLVAAATRIGAVLAEATRLAAPSRIVIGGLLVKTGDAMMVPLQIAFAQWAMSGTEPEIVAVPPERVERIELAGAVEYGRRQLDF
jgi:glucokinase